MKSRLFAAVAAVAVAVPAARAEEKDIVGVAAGNPSFSTLVAAVKAAGLVGTLEGKGPFTVFAPTNEAFEKLGKEKVDAVLQDKALLKKILLAHVVVGKKVTAADAAKLDGTDVNGFRVRADAGGVTIGEAKVVKADIPASNGVIHVIDTVLIPKE